MPEDCSSKEAHIQAVEQAIRIAESFAAGATDVTAAARTAARTAADAATGAAADAARTAADAVEAAWAADAIWAATTAEAAVRSAEFAVWAANDSRTATDTWTARDAWPAADICVAAAIDFEKLLDLGLGHFPDLGQSIDPSESGPLGPLWPEGEPGWLPKTRVVHDAHATATFKLQVNSQVEVIPQPEPQKEPYGDSELVVEIDVPEGISDDEIVAVISRLSLETDDLHRALGGHGLKVKRLEVYEGAPAPVEVPRR